MKNDNNFKYSIMKYEKQKTNTNKIDKKQKLNKIKMKT